MRWVLHIERKKIELDEVTQNLEDLGYDYRFIRGLTALLDRKCKLASKSPIESSKIRRMVFSLTQRDGLPTTNQARKKILDEAANNLHLPSENIEEYYHELNGTYANYSRITHILIDSNMKYSCVHVGERFEPQFMINETWSEGYDKFKKQPFNLIYGNYSKAINPDKNESISWAEVYEVNWTYIESILPSIDLEKP